MSDWIGRVPAVAQQVLKGLVSSHRLVLAKCLKKIGKFVFWYIEGPHRLCQRYKYGMPRAPGVTGVQLGFPLIEQSQRSCRITDLIAQIIRDPAVGVDVEEMLTKLLRQETGNDGEIFVMPAGQPTAVLPSFQFRRRLLRNSIFRRQTGPPRRRRGGRLGTVAGDEGHCFKPSDEAD